MIKNVNMASLIKKINDWFIKSSTIFIVILFIAIIPLYIIFLGKYINDKIVNILVALAAIISTYFLYLAFREAKKANELKINEPLLNQFDKEVTELENKSNNTIFSADGAKLLSICIDYNVNIILLMTYSSYYSTLITLIDRIDENDNYREIIKQLGNYERLFINEENDKNIGIALNKISTAMMSITSNYSSIYYKYYTIDNSDIEAKHKVFLFNRLSKLRNEHIKLINDLTKDTDNGKMLKNMTFLYYNYADTITKAPMPDFNYIVMLNGLIDKIQTKYN
ncbi:MAG: hypothetical protein ABSG89_11365 [Bacteroidales bacterium]|jgi:hypothetical protein